MPRFAVPLAPVLLAVGLMLARPAWAQDESRQDIALQNQILELRQDVDALRAQVSQGGGGAAQPVPVQPAPSDSGNGQQPNDMTAQLLNRVSSLEDEMRSLSGRIDELQNGLQKQNADLGKQVGDLDFRLKALEGNKPGDAAAGSDTLPAPAPDGAAPPFLGKIPASAKPVPVAGGLVAGYAALARRDYPAAEASARQVLATPRAPRAYDARFLLAQSLAGQKDYQKAALAYDDTYSASRKGTHAEDSLVGLAGSLASLGAKPAACATLSKLRAEFGALRPDVKASAAFIGKRAACR